MKPLHLFLLLVLLLVLYLVPSAHAAPASTLEAMVAQKLSGEIPSSLGVTAVTFASSVKAIDERSLSFTWKTPPKEGFSDVQLRYTLKNKDYSSWVRVELRPYREVLVASRDLELGVTLAPGDLIVKRLALRSGEGLSFAPPLFDGSSVRLKASAGQLITEAIVALPPLIARGTTLTVLVQRGALRIATSGTLEQQARAGERSSVRLSDGKLVQGQLQDSTTFLVSGGAK